MAVDLRAVGGFLAHLIGLFFLPIITVHLVYTFGWTGCKTSISLTYKKLHVSFAKINKKVKAHMAHVSQKNSKFHITKIRTLSKVKVIQCNMIFKVWPTGYLLFKFHNAITNKKCQDIVKQEGQSPYGSRVSEKLEFYPPYVTSF